MAGDRRAARSAHPRWHSVRTTHLHFKLASDDPAKTEAAIVAMTTVANAILGTDAVDFHFQGGRVTLSGVNRAKRKLSLGDLVTRPWAKVGDFGRRAG